MRVRSELSVKEEFAMSLLSVAKKTRREES